MHNNTEGRVPPNAGQASFTTRFAWSLPNDFFNGFSPFGYSFSIPRQDCQAMISLRRNELAEAPAVATAECR